jgi:hypothetical protein
MEGVKNNNRKYCRVRKQYNNRSCARGMYNIINSCREGICLCCGEYRAKRQGTRVGIITLYGNSGGSSCTCVGVVRGMDGRQGSRGIDGSTAWAGQEGHCRQGDGTESTQDSRRQSSWQLTTAERILDSDSCRGNISRCVQSLQNLTGTALFKRDRHSVIVLIWIAHIYCYYISMRTYLGGRLAFVGVEAICHV